jgi:hypothetical protein
MDMKERIEQARAALAGVKTRIVKSGGSKRKAKGRPRKVSSIVRGKPKNEMSAKDRYRQCGKKVRYKSEHEARVHANNAETKRGVKLRVYGPCPVCNGWHITKNADRGRPE